MLLLFYLASKISETQNPLAICHHDDLNALLRPVSQQVQNLTPDNNHAKRSHVMCKSTNRPTNCTKGEVQKCIPDMQLR